MKTILSTTSSFAVDNSELLEMISGLDIQVILNPHKRQLSELEVIEFLSQYKPVGLLAGTEPITRAVLELSKGYLRIISRVGVGWDNIDKEAASELGIKIYRTEGVLTHAVAELTVGLILSALRSIPLHDRLMRQKKWKKQMGHLLYGKTVGIIGFGSIGKRVGEMMKAFGSEVVFYDPLVSSDPGAKFDSLQGLLKQADIISIHASGKECILGRKELESTCKGVIVINTARGEMIDKSALENGLKSGHIRFACLDVFEEEPYNGILCDIENVILTPHIGSYALEARNQMERIAIDNILKGFRELGISIAKV
jgi:D-3-phosphoglycerate dehydrogenase